MASVGEGIARVVPLSTLYVLPGLGRLVVQRMCGLYTCRTTRPSICMCCEPRERDGVEMAYVVAAPTLKMTGAIASSLNEKFSGMLLVT
jgi:hypothetical protein